MWSYTFCKNNLVQLTLAELHPRTNIRDYFGKVALLSFSWLSSEDKAQISHRKCFLNLNLDGKTVPHT